MYKIKKIISFKIKSLGTLRCASECNERATSNLIGIKKYKKQFI